VRVLVIILTAFGIAFPVFALAAEQPRFQTAGASKGDFVPLLQANLAQNPVPPGLTASPTFSTHTTLALRSAANNFSADGE
jgi:hypothetical protein